MSHSIIGTLLIFRLKQAGRAVRAAGWRTVIVLGFILIIVVPVLLSYQPWVAPTVYLLGSVALQFSRRDQKFLQKLNLPYQWIFLAEYNLMVLPISLVLVFHQQIIVIITGHLLTALVAFLPVKRSYRKHKTIELLSRRIPSKLFEWRCYFRNHPYFLPAIYVLAIFLSPFTAAIPVALLIFAGSFPEVYNRLEPKELIQNYPRRTRFLRAKLYDHSTFIRLALMPLYLLFLLFHHSFWPVLLLLILFMECSIIFGLIYKYAQLNHTRANIHNQLPFFIFFCLMIFFFPAALFYIYQYLRKAKNTWLHDA